MGFNVCVFNGTQIASYMELQLQTLHTLSLCLKRGDFHVQSVLIL